MQRPLSAAPASRTIQELENQDNAPPRLPQGLGWGDCRWCRRWKALCLDPVGYSLGVIGSPLCRSCHYDCLNGHWPPIPISKCFKYMRYLLFLFDTTPLGALSGGRAEMYNGQAYPVHAIGGIVGLITSFLFDPRESIPFDSSWLLCSNAMLG